ncbi:alpha/beta fold hydrolase [Sinanaerobacter chloroacetimidivorans]|uniref:Alpha/beta fold hydrolase n=1 Tax=Sinanaerobacter chloroacetimidivorans TaxID=2818044 RepID=A0A8J8B0M5_9FIRM|nr:alpha/beta fold hydrolase [Sinanaerobacter chloroacetimidivorans]MBR0596786.1 alpha/beta fold hydrolase [Sinanaerobacter chloroacetimidivorans]
MFRNFKEENKGIRIHGYEWEPKNPQIVVCLVHGIGEHAGRYDRIGEIFKEAGISLLGMDLRGHGFSSGVRGHAACRKDIFADIDWLITYAMNRYPGLPVILYGHSMGGNLVLDYRRRGPLRSIPEGYLVTSPWVLLRREIPGHLYFFVKLISKIKPDFQMNSGVKQDTLGNKEIIGGQINSHLNHGKISVQTAIECFDIGRALMDGKVEKFGDEPLRPLLLMQGEGDQICSPEGSRKIAELEGDLCQYMEWQGFDHEIHNGNDTEDGTEVISAMVSWIQKMKISATA